MLKNAFVRRGIVFLEPKYVILKGHQTEDLEAHQDRDFVRGLRSRMGLVHVLRDGRISSLLG